MPMSYDPNDPAVRERMEGLAPQRPVPLRPAYSVKGAVIGAGVSLLAYFAITGDYRGIPSARSLEGVAVFSDGTGIRVCSRQDLHNCTARRGVSGGRERIYATIPLLRAVPSCDSQSMLAVERCRGVGDGEATVRCYASYGVIEGSLSSLSDPRDRVTIEPRGFVMRCDEGTRDGTFGEEGY